MLGRLLSTRSSRVGFCLLVAIVLVAVLGPYIAPHSPTVPIGVPGASPGHGSELGTDFLGRDVLSRLLYGGRSVIALGFTATALAYSVGLLVGLVAGTSRSLVDPALMRSVDLCLSFPTLLLLLLLITAFGSSASVLVFAVAAVQAPPICRVVRTATLEVSVRGYVEAAYARGERLAPVLWYEILPNIVSTVLADAGLRFTYSILLIASANFLGLGLAPPAADWGLMISENRQILDLNPWSVLAPAVMLAILTVSVNLVGDGITRGLGRSSGATRPDAGRQTPAGDIPRVSHAAVESSLQGRPT